MCFRLFFLRFPLSDEVRGPRVRAGGIIRRVAEVQDVLVAADRKAFGLAEFRDLKFLAQFLAKVLAPRLVAGEALTEAGDLLALT